MSKDHILITKKNSITTLSLNRPDKRNAMHGPLISELSTALKEIAEDETRVLIINGNGENFCAGGDIAWMQKMAECSQKDNEEDAQLLAQLLYQLYHFPKPTIVLAHGSTLGGGLGLLAAADIAIASKNAIFGLPEVKMGITPSIISPYVIAAIGERIAHFYFLTGERFSAEIAFRIGLIHRVTEDETLLAEGISIAQTLLLNSPHALQTVKKLIRFVNHEKISEPLIQQTAKHLAELRVTDEAQEGLKAFLEKRKPRWQEH